MTKINFKKKILGKPIQKASQLRPNFLETTPQNETITPSTVNQNCLSKQSDRGRVIVFIDGSNLLYSASYLKLDVGHCSIDLAIIQQTVQKLDDNVCQPLVSPQREPTAIQPFN